jgi:hypothetical protein
MRRTADSLIAGALLGALFVACSSDDSTPAASADDTRSSVGANQPQSMNAAGAAGQTSDPGTAAASGAGGGSAGAGSATSPTGTAPANEGQPNVGLAGAANSGNAGGGTPNGNGNGNAAPDAGASGGETPEPTSMLGIFVATASDSGGDLGGLAGADATCQSLAAGVGAGDRTWHAYLSTSMGDARDRIGDGPWVNANGIVVATDLADLHSLTAARGTPLVDLFVDQAGNRINGQWAGSPTPNQHDMLTGSAADGTRLAATCNDWTSATATPGPQVGHSDGLGPGMNGAGNLGSWNSSHAPQGCSQQQLIAVGGAGRFYCFAAD